MTREEFTKIIKNDLSAKFEVLKNDTFFKAGDIITLQQDDNTNSPFFLL